MRVRSRRSRVAVTAITLCTSFGAALAVTGESATASSSTVTGGARTAVDAAERPNVLLIMTDDQTRADMAVMNTVRNRLGDAGTTFSRAFSHIPLCCPARASVLTGQYAHNNGVMSLHGFRKFHSRFRNNNLAVWLREAGYNTVLLGKYLNGYPGGLGRRYVPPGWSEWQVPVRGVYNYRRFTMNENGRLRSYRTYQTTHWQSRGSRLVERYASADKPFFMWLSFVAPHFGGPTEPDDPRAIVNGGLKKTPNVANAYRNAFEGTPLPKKPSFLEKNMSDKPALRGTLRRPAWQYRELFQQRRESLLSVDDAVGRILNALNRSGEAGRTVVIFTSDNGYLLGEHRKVGKIVGYEESVGVPMVVRGPGFATDVRRRQLVSLTDLTSTILQAAGVSPQLRQDGLPLQPASNNPAVGADRPILLEAAPTGRMLYTGIRTADDRVLLRWRSGSRELYDLNRDPFQLNGRVSAGETFAERANLSARLNNLQDCAGASCH